MSVEVSFSLSSIFFGGMSKKIDQAMEASIFIVERAYVDESPGDTGDLKQGIQVRRNSAMNYLVESTAEDRGFSYPTALYFGTGKLAGLPDFGFTTGHVRAGTVAFGIGGIRPNKASDRAKAKSERPYREKVDLLLNIAIERDRTISTR